MSNQFISLAEAIAMTSRYRSDKENILANGYKNQGILPICETFDKSAIDALTGETGCVKIRVYFGMKSDLKVSVILVGVNAEGEDLLPEESSFSGPTPNDLQNDNVIVEEGIRCPTTCPPPSALNED